MVNSGMSSKLEHTPNVVKHVADAVVGASVIITSWIVVLTPLLEFGILILAAVWGYFRIKDIILSVKLKQLKIRRHEDH